MQLGPVAGPIGRAPEGGRNWEGFSPDPWLTGQLFASSIKGIQSTGMMTTAKHFIGNEQENFRQVGEAVGYGFNITEPGSSNIDDQTLHEVYMWPFADAIKAGTTAVMCSYNRVNNSQACQNSYTLNYLLKQELGFQGYVLSDWQANSAGVSGILAGLDLAMPGDTRFDTGNSFFGPNLTIAVLNGTVPQWRLDDMVTRVLAGWYFVDGPANSNPVNFNSWTLETFGPLYNYVGSEWGHGLINQHVDVRAQHGALIRQIAAESTVLLKNVNNTLPLSGKERLTAVFGEDAASHPNGPNGCPDNRCDSGTLGMGFGSGQGAFPYLVSPETGIQNEIVSHYGSFESITNNSALAQIQALARRTDQVDGVCLCFANADSGEGFIDLDGNYGDRKNLTLWQGADAVITNVTANCKNTVIVIHSGGAVNEFDKFKHHPNVTAVIWAGMPGEQSGNSIADVLYGRVNPGAKLPFTIGKKRTDYGVDLLYKPNGDIPQFNFEEGVFIDYRHFDQNKIEPTYEFGFGMSYTSFKYSNLKVQKRNVQEYRPNTKKLGPAPTRGTINNDTSAHVFPANMTRVPLYIYPWLNSTDLEKSYGWNDYGDNSFIPEGALDGSSVPAHPAGGAPGGNPMLWDVMYCVTVDVTNTGRVAGSEVPQLYISHGGEYDPPKVLRGFERVKIGAGQRTTVSFDITRRDLSNWDTDSQNWVVTKAPKKVFVGSSSRDLPLSATLGEQKGYGKWGWW